MRMGYAISLSCVTLVLGSALAACSSRPVQHTGSLGEHFHRELFPGSAGYVVESREEIFYLDREIKDYLERRFRWAGSGPAKLINEEIFSEQITEIVKDFAYENLSDVSASQTFQDKTANCLSLSIMTYSMARYLGFEVNFQMVNIPEYWEWHENTSLVARHVNLLLKRKAEPGVFNAIDKSIEIDFLSPGSSRRYGARQIAIPTVMAMFYNNKGAEALLAGNHDKAYAYFRAALIKDPSLNMALSNLGLLYAMNGRLGWAEQAYRQALQENPDDTVSAAGLASVYRLSGDFEKAEEIMGAIRKKREKNPYYQYVQGEKAYAAGSWEKSIGFFKKAISLRSDIDLFYFGMAKSYYQLGEHELAERYMRQAERSANYEEAKKRYQRKLVLLGAY